MNISLIDLDIPLHPKLTGPSDQSSNMTGPSDQSSVIFYWTNGNFGGPGLQSSG
ncbi:hypothetical protein DPMN_070056 [Dreissena polymorpha]|uniref:Uncharacterized protein n=1 Tax=Dreissena polymorpha TaxID=45954 RepID=A0A9D4BUV0_DREPO|nr:hypothetical protein DPMN_070056 [Dreissena polymorpha]